MGGESLRKHRVYTREDGKRCAVIEQKGAAVVVDDVGTSKIHQIAPADLARLPMGLFQMKPRTQYVTDDDSQMPPPTCAILVRMVCEHCSGPIGEVTPQTVNSPRGWYCRPCKRGVYEPSVFVDATLSGNDVSIRVAAPREAMEQLVADVLVWVMDGVFDAKETYSDLEVDDGESFTVLEAMPTAATGGRLRLRIDRDFGSSAGGEHEVKG